MQAFRYFQGPREEMSARAGGDVRCAFCDRVGEGFDLDHCNDFMAYIGTWEPAAFVRNSPMGDGRDLFLRMTRDPGLQFLWDTCLGPDEAAPAAWRVTYYAFRCLHCGELAGNWDCD